jgi:hypothetical protein
MLPESLHAFLRNPKQPDGSPAGGAPFPPGQLSREQGLHIHHGIIILLFAQSSVHAAAEKLEGF